MITPKFILIGAVALVGLVLAPSAEASDHHHHGDRRDHWGHDHGYYGQRYHGYDQGYYYDQGPSVVYGNPYYYGGGGPYYGRSNVGVTFAFGGHHRHHYYH
jgi:hypothetical protein